MTLCQVKQQKLRRSRLSFCLRDIAQAIVGLYCLAAVDGTSRYHWHGAAGVSRQCQVCLAAQHADLLLDLQVHSQCSASNSFN